ncbi:MAG: hypothetical protein ACD_71C00077G0006, partial [uncultured bacterium (gcode 4)]
MTNYSDEISIRTEKLARIQSLGIIPYAAKFDKKDSIVSLIGRDQKGFRAIETIIPAPIDNVQTAGRITLYRSFGKIAFARLQDALWEIQIMFSRENCQINIGET